MSSTQPMTYLSNKCTLGVKHVGEGGGGLVGGEGMKQHTEHH